MQTASKIEAFYFFIICFLTISFTYAQTEIKSKVVDFASLMPIESANVYIQNTTIGTVSNVDGKFSLVVPDDHKSDTLVISSIGYKNFKTRIDEFENESEIYLEEDIAALDEVLLIAETRPTTGNEIVQRAIEKLPNTMPEQPYLLKGFLRHKERNKRQFKWLIESAITVYDSSYTSNSAKNLKINVDEVRKSFDLRDVDSLFAYAAYLKNKGKRNLKAKNLRRDTIARSSLVNAIKWNDNRVNGLDNLLKGKLNLIRNSNADKALFNESLLDRHQFLLDTVLVDDGRKIYKIKIDEGKEFVDLETKGIYNDGYVANGWLYIYWDNYAIKKIEYDLVAASDVQKRRSKDLFGTQTNHKLVITYKEFEDAMYPNYIYYETPKLVNVGLKPTSTKTTDLEKEQFNRNERYYYTVQEILFTDIIFDEDVVANSLNNDWDSDIFASKPYNTDFWKNYNTLLESEEEEKLINDLTKRSSLFKE